MNRDNVATEINVEQNRREGKKQAWGHSWGAVATSVSDHGRWRNLLAGLKGPHEPEVSK